VQRHTLHGDPRGAFVDGIDTTAPAPHHAPKNTGVHGVGTGDPRAAWQANPTVESAEAWQEEKDFRRAVSSCVQSDLSRLHPVMLLPMGNAGEREGGSKLYCCKQK